MNATAIQLETIVPRWVGERCVIAATGPSLTPAVADAVREEHCIAVNDAYRLLPWADILFACDAAWWTVHQGCPAFAGEKWSSHHLRGNDKLETAERYGVRLVRGRDAEGFSTDPRLLHYGSTSTFQAINLAILFGATSIILIGCDMRNTTPRHFFGEHPRELKNFANFSHFIPPFVAAAASMPGGVRVINCTPGSALTCFPMQSLQEALR